jgi:hypothetical protein
MVFNVSKTPFVENAKRNPLGLPYFHWLTKGIRLEKFRAIPFLLRLGDLIRFFGIRKTVSSNVAKQYYCFFQIICSCPNNRSMQDRPFRDPIRARINFNNSGFRDFACYPKMTEVSTIVGGRKKAFMD